jgi:glycosyltransferase involved in cell wall biosynthesis
VKFKKYDVCFVCCNYIKNDARTLNLANTLVDLGKSVLVICLKDNPDLKFKFDILEVPVSLEGRLYKNLFKFTHYIRQNFRNIKSDFFVASELYSLAAARFLQKGTSGKLIYDSREIFSAPGNTYNHPIKQLFFTYLEKLLINKVDSVIVTGKLDAEYLQNYFKKHFEYFLIMNLPFKKEIMSSDKIRSTFNIDSNVKIILYQGLIISSRGIEPAIRAMKYLDGYALCIMGDGGSELIAYYRNLVRELDLSHKVFFKSFVPYNELHEWTCSADIGLALFEPVSLSYKLALPNKLFEYAMAGLPSISTNLPAIKEVNDGICFTELIEYPFDDNTIAVTIKKVNQTEIYSNYRKNAISASNIYNYETQINTIKRIFDNK